MNDHKTTFKDKMKGLGNLKKLDVSKFNDRQELMQQSATLSCSL